MNVDLYKMKVGKRITFTKEEYDNPGMPSVFTIR
jgi:hypothetical protein